jgi:hypothetical protein
MIRGGDGYQHRRCEEGVTGDGWREISDRGINPILSTLSIYKNLWMSFDYKIHRISLFFLFLYDHRLFL